MKLYSNRPYFKTIILTWVFLLSMTGVAFAQSSEKLDYVALGDSLVAGYAPNGTIDKSYTDFIAVKLDGEGVLGDYRNFGVPGYTTDKVFADINPDNPVNANRIVAISNAEIITLDVGANDLLGMIRDPLFDPTQAPAAIKNVAGNIFKITSTLKGLNPNAKIYLMGYYNAFPYLPEEQQAQLIPLIKGFNQTVKGVADLKDSTGSTIATYVDTYTTMDKHLAKYLPEDNIHPDISGYRAIAKDFWDIIKVDFLRGVN
ncbi:GDSL-type esterase/lipase family protein [Desulfosporosinus sp. BG]|uniref:SGNH/GDSL hydrolase family protein n=1 Tax=Desulfosporosinus sp. BG TaxID=1633135 RepID=UPI00083B913D|nr:GDSL-type esterase/lipase family protein [Desulfosporosinus sp. BG]ODA41921.1 Lipase/Acylhydrolase with GDSL-like motif [Desulfosporosinus sp. BG]